MLIMKFLEKFGKDILFFDGGMGTQLQRYGLKSGDLPENMNITNPDVLFKIHKAYLDAGCDIVTTNTFGANGLKFNNVAEIVTSAVNNAKNAIADCTRECYIALDIGPLGKLLEPYGDLPFETAYELFKEQAVAGEKAGANFVLIETMSDLYEIKAAVLAVKENTNLPVLASMIFDDSGRLLTGGDIKTAIFTLEGLSVDGIGLNCGLGPDQMVNLFDEVMKYTSTPVFSQPNAGLPNCVNGVTTYNVTPEEFAEKQYQIARKGTVALGGCCGTTPDHIKALTEKCKSIKIKSVENKNFTAVTSYSKTVFVGEEPIEIGRKINPTDEKIADALRNDDIDYIIDEAMEQVDDGADILNINVCMPDFDETAIMKNVVTKIQELLNVPLCIDTRNADALDQALRIYNGRAMVNSANINNEKLSRIIKKYGAVEFAKND